MIIRSRSPVRIEFGGGGTDMPQYYENYSGCVLNATINKYVYGTLVPKHTNDMKFIASGYKTSALFKDIREADPDADVRLIKAIISEMKISYGIDVFVRSDIPPNTGLGSNATVASAVIGLFNHLKYEKGLNKYEIAELAYKVANLGMQVPGGKQCQYASTFGGINFIEFSKKGTYVHPLNLKKETVLELEKNLLLIYIGQRGSHAAVQNIIQQQQQSYTENQKIELLDKLKTIAIGMRYSLLRNDLTEFGELLGEAWETKKILNPSITNDHINELYRTAVDAGALGGRIMGAGGGGHMLFYAKSNKEHEVAKALEEKGASVMDFCFEHSGMETWEVNE
ncbi:MAG: GHMP kinase [Candidatus Woesearchaeota archaeon]